MNRSILAVATLGLIFSAIYSLRIMQKVFFGEPEVSRAVKDLSWREKSILASLTLCIIALGVFPQPIITTARPLVKSIERIFIPANEAEVQKDLKGLPSARRLSLPVTKKESYVRK